LLWVKLSASSPRYLNAGPGQIEIPNYTLQILIFMAYRVSDYSLSGPDWLGSVNLDVVAKLPASAVGLSPEDRVRMTGVMLRGLLASVSTASRRARA
jgi:uncharacterized protein (TIGR03435 family)